MKTTWMKLAGSACAVLGMAVGLGFGQSAIAQDGEAPVQTAARSTIDVINVTGTKREEASQSVPIAITAISGDQLKNEFRNDILAIGEMSPGVSLGQSAGFRAIAGGIRGTGQNSILVTQDSSVVILVDDFALSNVQAQFVEMFDVERVEVYRGPQGTLFGKSATGGAISIITKKPVLNEFSADIEGQIGMWGGDDAANGAIAKARLAVNIPVVEDKLAIRVVGIYDYDDGFYKNDKNTATFPEVIPFYDIIGVGAVDAPLPPELDTQHVGSGENLNGTDIFAGRFKVLFAPTDNYEAVFTYEILRDRSGTVPGVNESPALGELDNGAPQFMLLPLLGFPGIQAAGQDNVFSTGVTNQCIEGNPQGLCLTAGQRVSVDGLHLRQQLDLDEVTFQLITGYRDQREILPNTYTGEAFTSLFDASRNTTKEDFQAELRASTNFDGPFNFVAGLSYAWNKTDMLSFATVGLSGLITFVDQDRNDGVPGPVFDDRGFLNLDLDFLNDPTSTGARQSRDTYAFYADGTFDVTDRLSITAGMRYTYDKKDFFRRQNPGGPCTALTPQKDQVLVDGVCLDARSNAISRVGGGFSPKDLHAFTIPLPDSAFGIAESFSDSWEKVTWRAVIDYNFDDDSMVYLSYATGFIPGGFTETCSSLATCQPFESETNWNVEAGMKAQFAQNTVQTNLAVFYTRYSDLVRSQVVPFTNAFGVTTQETINVNAGSSEVWGVEFEGTWLATENLTLALNVGFMDHDYREFVLNDVDFSDRKVPFSPKWKVGGAITYDIYLGNNGGLVVLNTNFNYQSEAEMSVFNSLRTQMEERFLWDANITWRDAEEKYRVTLFAKNILDETHRIAANSVAGLWNFTMFGRPRSFGVDFGLYF